MHLFICIDTLVDGMFQLAGGEHEIHPIQGTENAGAARTHDHLANGARGAIPAEPAHRKKREGVVGDRGAELDAGTGGRSGEGTTRNRRRSPPGGTTWSGPALEGGDGLTPNCSAADDFALKSPASRKAAQVRDAVPPFHRQIFCATPFSGPTHPKIGRLI